MSHNTFFVRCDDGPWVRAAWGTHPFEALETDDPAVFEGRSPSDVDVTSLSPARLRLRSTRAAGDAAAVDRLACNPENVSEPDRPRLRVGAYTVCVAERDGEPHVLLTRLAEHGPDGGLWSLPGGGLDPGEHPRDAARRETWEETGMVPVLSAGFRLDSEVWGRWRDLTPVQAIRVLYRATVRGTPRIVKERDSTDAVAWWPLRSLPDTNTTVPRALKLFGLD